MNCCHCAQRDAVVYAGLRTRAVLLAAVPVCMAAGYAQSHAVSLAVSAASKLKHVPFHAHKSAGLKEEYGSLLTCHWHGRGRDCKHPDPPCALQVQLCGSGGGGGGHHVVNSFPFFDSLPRVMGSVQFCGASGVAAGRQHATWWLRGSAAARAAGGGRAGHL